MTLLSRITGLVRDVAFANIMGTAVVADAFFVAFRIPNFFRRIFGEGALSVAFVPVLTDYKEHHGAAETRHFLDCMAGRLGLILLGVTAVGVLAAPLLVSAIAYGFRADPEKFELTVNASRIMFPYLMFISLVAMAAGILNTYNRFAAPAVTPVLLNLSLIAAVLWLVPVMENAAIGLAAGVLVAGMVQFLFQLPFLEREGLLPRPRLVRRHQGVSQVFKLMLPALFGVSVAQINLLVNTLLASFLVTGSVSWLYYSDRLMEFPLGVFGIALATVILPSLSKKYSHASMEEFSDMMDWALRWVCLIVLPATVALCVLPGPLVTTMFQYGAFSAHDVTMAGRSLIGFAIGLPALVLVKVLAPGFYARQDTKTPVRVGVIAMVANIVCSVALIFHLAHVGLALATSIAAWVNALLLYRILWREGVYRPRPGWIGFAVRVTSAAGLMGTLLWWGKGDLAVWVSADLFTRIVRLAFWISCGATVYFLGILISGIRPHQLMLEKE